MKQKFRKIISIIMIAAVIAGICVMSTVSSGASGTGAGLAEWALNAYYSNWSYVYGGSTPGAVDCSGLIYSYCGGNRTSMLSDAQANGRDWGYVSSGIPRVHGLGLSRPGHVGVYIADNMEVDARGDEYGVCYDEIGGWNGWDCWFKLTAVSYPDTGWEEFNGDSYYYENGEYIVSTTRVIDGETYTFDAKGAASKSGSQAASVNVEDESAASNEAKTETESETKTEAKAENASLKKGSTGNKVEKLQTRLQELGYYNGIIDGDFGDGTETAFKLFQQARGLYVDGIAGSDADYLYAEDAPAFTQAEKKDETGTEETVGEDATESGEEEEATVASEKEELAATGTDSEEETTEADAEEIPAEEETAGMNYSTGDYSDDVYKIQERLIGLGYMDGVADGEYGSATETAVMNFQAVNGLAATGVVEQSTYDLLFSDGAVVVQTKEEEPTESAEEKAETEDADDKADKAAAEDETEAEKEPVEAAAPAVVETNDTPADTSSSVPDTQIEKTTSELSAKSVAAVTDNALFKRGANATNFQFILWLAVMIVVMMVAFAIVYAVEKKKQKAARHGRRFQ